MNLSAEAPQGAKAMKEPKPKARANITAPKDTIDIKGFNKVSVNDDVTIIIKGRLSELRDKADEWDPGKNISLEPTSVEIRAKGKKTSISEAIAKTDQKV
jgi:hypothetical protein